MFEGWTLDRAKLELELLKKRGCKSVFQMLYRQALAKYINEHPEMQGENNGTRNLSQLL